MLASSSALIGRAEREEEVAGLLARQEVKRERAVVFRREERQVSRTPPSRDPVGGSRGESSSWDGVAHADIMHGGPARSPRSVNVAVNVL